MHEMHFLHKLKEDLLKRAIEEKCEKVTKIYIKMGPFSEINPEILHFYFVHETANTPLAGAMIEIEKSDKQELTLVSFDCE